MVNYYTKNMFIDVNKLQEIYDHCYELREVHKQEVSWSSIAIEKMVELEEVMKCINRLNNGTHDLIAALEEADLNL